MGEIRSTIDLMMERTKGMALSDEEKEKFRREELEKKARGLRTRLVENPADADRIISGIDEEDPKKRREILDLLWDELVDALIPGRAGAKLLDVLEKLPRAEEKADVLARMRSELKSAEKNRVKDVKKVLNRERKKLASIGISGSAVVPKLPEDAESQETAHTMEDLKAKLR